MVIAYLRVSTGRQNLDNQESEIIRYTKAREIKVDRWITEKVSGKTSRDERLLGNVIRKLKSGDTLIVTELSRLSRSLHEIMHIMKYCIDHKVIIHSTKDGLTFDDSINSKVLSFAFGLAAEIEHKLISLRTKEALASRKAEGKHIGRLSGTDFKMQLLHSERKNVLEMIQKGVSQREIYGRYLVSQNTFYRFRMVDEEVNNAILNRNTEKEKKQLKTKKQ